MFKRLFWLMVGAGFGFGVSFWLMRFVKETAARYTPERVSQDLAGAVRAFGQDLREAVAEGRAAMQEREAELRGETDARLSVVPPLADADGWDDVDEPPARSRGGRLRAARTASDEAPEAPAGPTGKLAKQLAERLSR